MPATGCCATFVRSLIVRACEESSPKTSRLECCTARSAFRSFYPNSPFALTLRPRCSGCPPPGYPGFYCDFKVLDGQGRPLRASAGAQRQPLVKCCFGNTRLKTASRSVQNASLSLPVGACELV